MPPTRKSQSRTWSAQQLEFEQTLRDGPTAALDHFCTLYNTRTSRPIKSETDEIVLLADVLAERLESSAANTDAELQRAATESDFAFFLMDVIGSSDFFNQCHGFVFAISRALMTMMKYWLDQIENSDGLNRNIRVRILEALGHEFWSLSAAMWKGLWDQRSTFARLFGIPSWRPIAIFLDVLAQATEDLRNQIHPNLLSNPVMIQVAYCAWIHLHGSERLTENDITALPFSPFALELCYNHYQLLTEADDGSSAVPKAHMFMEGLMMTLDTRALTRAAHNTLSHTKDLVGDTLIAYLRLLEIQMKFVDLRWYASPPLLEALALVGARQITHSDASRPGPSVTSPRELGVYEAAYRHIEMMIPGLKSGAIPSTSFPGNRFWDIVVGGLFPAYYVVQLLRHESGYCECGDHAILDRSLSTFLSQFFALINTFVSEIRQGHIPRSVIHGVRDAGVEPRMQVTGIWYGDVRHLRDFIQYHPSTTTYMTMLDAWLKLGDALGIEETAQRDLEMAEKARQCCWRMCMYHTTPSEKPLLVCKGCKEARYCSVACQRNDWKQGGHRTECRRVK